VPFSFEKDLYPLLMKTLDVYWLVEQRTENIRDPLIRSFSDIDDLEEHAKDTENFQLQGMLEIVEKYHEEFPGVVFELSERTKDSSAKDNAPGIVLSTIHSAKGQEYEQVYIDSDMAENIERVITNELQDMNDEINVAYVGFTRAIRNLYLPQEFQHLFSPKWGRLLQGYQIGTTQQVKRTGYPRPPASPRRHPTPVQPKVSSQKQRRPGERVHTSFGPGVILEVSGEFCLIDLGNHGTKLRERLSNIW
jgi:hypothetical protein